MTTNASMIKICEKCKGAGMAAMIGAAFILSCPIDIKKDKCPFLPPEVHTHEKLFIPIEIMKVAESAVTVVSSSRNTEHDSIIGRYDDSNRQGFTVYILNVKPD